MKLKGSGSSGDLNGFLDSGSRLQGELHFEDTFRIDGKLIGTVVSEGDLVVGVGGEVEGDILVSRVFISGLVRGRVKVTRRVEIAAGGRVFADLETPSLVVEDGAFFQGRCSMMSTAEAEKTSSGPKPLPAIGQAKER